MSLEVGDFVMQDTCVSEIKLINIHELRGYSLGSWDRNRYNPQCFQWRNPWYISKDAKKITPADLEEISRAIQDEHPELQKKAVKEFLNRLSKWCITNLT
jgi:hypothetical protein